jgi:hypothetical protein
MSGAGDPDQVRQVTSGVMLETARELAEVSVMELWLSYFALGGVATLDAVSLFLAGGVPLSAGEYDVLAHALNERFADLDGDHPVPYAEDLEEL